jgi:hypothetical protein
MEGHAAKAILDNPIVEEVFNLIEKTIHDQWEESAEPQAREELWFTLQGLIRFREILQVTVDNQEFDTTLKEKYNA